MFFMFITNKQPFSWCMEHAVTNMNWGGILRTTLTGDLKHINSLCAHLWYIFSYVKIIIFVPILWLLFKEEKIPVLAEKKGVITKIDAYKISEVSCKLGAGKLNIEDERDHSVGVLLNKQVGDKVEIGDTICTLYVHGVKEIFDIADAFTIEEEEKEEK